MKISDFSDFRQLSSRQKYIYTWPIENFLGVLKSYESESLQSRILSSPDKITDPPVPITGVIFAKIGPTHEYYRMP